MKILDRALEVFLVVLAALVLWTLVFDFARHGTVGAAAMQVAVFYLAFSVGRRIDCWRAAHESRIAALEDAVFEDEEIGE